MSRYTLTLSLVALVLSAFVWGLSSCGGGGGNSGAPVVKITPTDNQAPVAKRAFENIALSLESGGQAEWRSDDIGVYFSDPDGDSLEFRAESSNGDVASVAFAGDALEVRATGGGSATVTVTATDPRGLSGSQKFTVIVSDGTANNAPVIVRPFDDLTLTIGDGGEWESEEFLTYFSEPDGDTHTYRVEASPGDVVRAELHYVEGRGLTLIVQALKPGTATITVSMTDSGGLSTSQSFRVTVLDGVAPPPDHSDTPAGAVPVVVGQPVDARIDSPNDVDYFLLEVDEPGTIAVTIEAEPGVEIALLDSSGNVLSTAVTASRASLQATVAEKGRYFVRVLKRAAGAAFKPVKYVLKKVKVNLETVINIIRRIPKVVLDVGQASVTIDLTEHFQHPDGSPLAFRVSGSYLDSFSVTLQRSLVRISPGRRPTPGPVTLTVAASVPGEVAVDFFTVTIREAPNQPPLATKAFPALTLTPGCPVSIDLNEYFSDDDSLIFQVTRGSLHRYDGPAGARIVDLVSGDGHLEFSTVSGLDTSPRNIPPGPRDYNVIAHDPHGLEASQMLTLSYRVPDELTVRVPSLSRSSKESPESLTYAATSRPQAMNRSASLRFWDREAGGRRLICRGSLGGP